MAASRYSKRRQSVRAQSQRRSQQQPPPARSSSCAGRSSARCGRISQRRIQTKTNHPRRPASISLAVTSACVFNAERNRPRPACFCAFHHQPSSAFKTATPRALSLNRFCLCRRDVFNSSQVFKMNRRTINSTPTSGGVISTRRRISWVGDDIPISSTATSNWSGDPTFTHHLQN